MKRFAVALLVASMLSLGGSSPALAADTSRGEYEDGVMHPLRLVYYAFHPVGFALEWVVARPLNYVISRPYLDKVFGWEPLGEEADYRKTGERL